MSKHQRVAAWVVVALCSACSVSSSDSEEPTNEPSAAPLPAPTVESEPVAEPARQELAISSNNMAEGLRATLHVGDERIDVEVKRTTRTLQVGDPDEVDEDGKPVALTEMTEEVRTATVRGQSGVLYAEYVTPVEEDDPSGTFGDAPFGGAVDEENSIFLKVSEARAGVVIAAVAQAARAVSSPAKDSALEWLDYLDAMGNHLSFLSGQATAVMAGDPCKFSDNSQGMLTMGVGSNIQFSEGQFYYNKGKCGDVQYCNVFSAAAFEKYKTYGTCKRSYWVRLYTDKGNLLSKKQGKMTRKMMGYEIAIFTSYKGLYRKGSKVCRKLRFGDSAGNKLSSKTVCFKVNNNHKETVFWDTWRE